MRRTWILALGLAATTALGGALALPALAHGPGGDGPGRSGHEAARGEHGGMMEMMQRMHGQGTNGRGIMGDMGPMGAMMEAFDADGDGTTSPDELRAALQAQLAEYDADGDGTLSLGEFETLHAAMTRAVTVDRFQALDNDGDGRVTADEITAPADRMARMQARRDQMMQQAPGRATMPMQGMDDSMMDDDAPGDD